MPTMGYFRVVSAMTMGDSTNPIVSVVKVKHTHVSCKLDLRTALT